MSAAVATRTYTPEDLLAMPDGKRLPQGRRPPGLGHQPQIAHRHGLPRRWLGQPVARNR